MIRDGIYDGGRKVITFCGVLQQNVFPLPELMQMSMKLGADAAKLRAAQRLAEGQAPRPRRHNKYAPEGRDEPEGGAA